MDLVAFCQVVVDRIRLKGIFLYVSDKLGIKSVCRASLGTSAWSLWCGVLVQPFWGCSLAWQQKEHFPGKWTLLWVNLSSAKSIRFHGYPSRESFDCVKRTWDNSLGYECPPPCDPTVRELRFFLPGFDVLSQYGFICEKTFSILLVKSACKRRGIWVSQ